VKRALVLAFFFACRTSSITTTDARAIDAFVAPQEASVIAPIDAGTTTVVDDEEEEADASAPPGPCPQPINPGWCRHRCRSLANRQASKHAQRMQHSERVAFGKCGTFSVFAEDERAGDGGLQSGIIEYFGPSDTLEGAIDTRMKPCGRFGTIPACTPKLVWEESRAISLQMGTVVSPKLPPEVISRIVRQNFGRYKLCAQKVPGSARPVGRVVAKIAIAADGSVTSVQDDGSDLANRDTTACILKATELLAFPQPEGGATTVRVPMIFAH